MWLLSSVNVVEIEVHARDFGLGHKTVNQQTALILSHSDRKASHRLSDRGAKVMVRKRWLRTSECRGDPRFTSKQYTPELIDDSYSCEREREILMYFLIGQFTRFFLALTAER